MKKSIKNTEQNFFIENKNEWVSFHFSTMTLFLGVMIVNVNESYINPNKFVFSFLIPTIHCIFIFTNLFILSDENFSLFYGNDNLILPFHWLQINDIKAKINKMSI